MSRKLLSLNSLNTYYVDKYFLKTCFNNECKNDSVQVYAAYFFSTKKEKNAKCYNCQNDLNIDVISFFCKTCKSLVGVEVFKQFNIFELFNLDVNYDVDKNILKQQFSNVQKLFHPDKNSKSAEMERINEASSYLNNAYTVLNNDIERAIYLLKLLYNYEEDNENLEDEDFLDEIIKINEQIDSSKDIDALMKQYEIKYQNHIDELRLFFKEKNFEKILSTVKKLKFIDKILERIKNI